MPRRTTDGKRLLDESGGPKSTTFKLSDIFPPPTRPGAVRGPFPKQRMVIHLVTSGEASGGIVVYQGGKGCAKTITGATALITAHLKAPGLLSVIGRENYPAHVTSTWAEFEIALKRVPKQFIKSIKSATVNSMGIVEWQNGGRTLGISLSNSDSWESANIGVAWIDEGHRQDFEIVKMLNTRIRQQGAPRVLLITSNPAGKYWLYRWAHPKSRYPEKAALSFWIESNMYENPELPPDYVRRMEDMYPPGSPGHKRWVLGQSVALEGNVFGEIFLPDVDDLVHVVPPFDLPRTWRYGRGLDWGIDNPTVCVWAAKDPYGRYWFYRTHSARNLSARQQAKMILEKEAKDPGMSDTPADPSMWAKVHFRDGGEARYSVADEFFAEGCRITPANNNREVGLARMVELITVDSTKLHPVTMERGCPGIIILNTPDNAELIQGIDSLEWRSAPKTGNLGPPEDVKKKRDHEYDATRYLVMANPTDTEVDPIPAKPARHKGTRSYRGY